MITKSTLSILGLYNFDPTIFDEFSLPAEITDKGNEHLYMRASFWNTPSWKFFIRIPP